MPWFITAITSDEKITRTFGFFNEYHAAESAVLNNSGDMHEVTFDYIVVEYIEQGIHPHVRVEAWFKWKSDDRKWTKWFRPHEISKGVVNWALG